MKVTGYNAELSCYEIESSLVGDSIYLPNGEHFKNSLIIKGSDFPYKTEIDFNVFTCQPYYFFITADYEGLKCMLSEKCISLSKEITKHIYYRPSLPSDRMQWLIAPFELLF
ncbi:hypothetical protein DXN04_14105 [Chitinophaga silvisoli]|uniref:Uncharacterized protein n=2 Tax=Chitinophaga silvisoli TaxID=2291814 RepID=A0A3E1P2K3_9BACT|nr:hypothetical protein DXN04_14105 [Chitinophaga silvisoli]